ncbi:MAG TPA: ATP-binding protein [Xanthobacteraceae bacterium]|nr:ATP-binding protein [Xanthobacteraceae bacterium]
MESMRGNGSVLGSGVVDPREGGNGANAAVRERAAPRFWLAPMRQPHSIRVHLAAVFLIFFLLVVVLGLFSIWRLSNFNLLSVDVAERWLPMTRVLGDLNNFTSDFRAIEGSNLLSSDPSEIAATEQEMAKLDRSIAEAERGFERIRHDAAEGVPYNRFKQHWNDYREIVNRMLVFSRTNRKAEALAIYAGTSRAAYDAASDALGQLTDQAVANAQLASNRLGVAYRQAFWLILLGMAIAAVMVVAVLVHISRSISAPLLHLADRMRRLAANDTDIDISETDRRDEIGEMAQAAVVFRNNAIELMRSQRMLARQAAMLEEQLAQEQRLALLQRNFVSMASHEFRTPLTIIDGHARRLIKTKESLAAAEIGERAGKIRAAVLRLTHIIDNLLNSARLIDGGGALYFHPAEMDMAALLREICQLHREMTPGVQITERFAATPMPMIGDAKLLFQVFSNLLSNAVKYSPGGGSIGVDAEIAADSLVVTVSDRGIGIPAGDLDRLFQRYHRGSNVSGIVGTGVGLYLVKMAVDLHGGQVAVTSREGDGSRFTVRLPLKPAHAATASSPLAADSTAAEQAPPIAVSSVGAAVLMPESGGRREE